LGNQGKAATRGEKVMTYTVSFDDCPELRFVYTEKDFPLPWLVVGNIFEMASMHEHSIPLLSRHVCMSP
jgi:hypothetical protein